jgi:hypothetical protein
VPADSREDQYRVVATRGDGTQVVLARGLRIDRAKAIVEALADVSAFSKLEIARDSADGPAESG